MEIRIKLPNPGNTVGGVLGFIDQLELCLYHAKKSYEKMEKEIPEEKIEDISIYFSCPSIENSFGKDEKPIEELYLSDTQDNLQEMELVISY